MIMFVRPITAFVLLAITLSASATSYHDDSHYVSLGPRTGYYIVRPDSALSYQLGVAAAPTIDIADPFRHGYGADALAFRFNRAGILSAPPAYIVQAMPNEFNTRRVGLFIRAQSRLPDAKAFFGQPQSIERRPDGFIAHYAIQVYNPFEDRSGGGNRWQNGVRKMGSRLNAEAFASQAFDIAAGETEVIEHL